MNWVLATNLNVFISLQPDRVNLGYFKLLLLVLTEFTVLNIIYYNSVIDKMDKLYKKKKFKTFFAELTIKIFVVCACLSYRSTNDEGQLVTQITGRYF